MERGRRAFVVAPGFRLELHRGDAVAVDAGIDRLAALDRPDEQSGGDEQHQREGELAGHEHRAEPRSAPAGARALRLESIGDVASRPLQGRPEPEDHAGRERRGDGEREHPEVR